MSQTFNLVIYIQPDILNAGLANLTFARVVNGVSNVVFQSKDTDDLAAVNNLTWEENFRIGATQQDLKHGALISVGTSLQDIVPGTVCDWTTPANGKPVRDMPPATTAPSDFPQGSFGTVALPTKWKNTIWCKTGDSYNCIYMDTNPIDGLSYRSYIVENTFQLSWTTDAVSDSVLFKSWSQPWTFSIAPGQTNAYVSWGKPQNGGASKWYKYTTDPGFHNPSKAIVALSDSVQNRGDKTLGAPVGIRLGYDGNKALSVAGLSEYAGKLTDFIKASRPSYLDLKFSYDPTAVSAFARLDLSSSSYDLIRGSSTEEKTISTVNTLLSNLTGPFIPLTQIIELAPSTTDDDGTGVPVPTFTNFSAVLNWTGAGSANWDSISTDVSTKLDQVDPHYTFISLVPSPSNNKIGNVFFKSLGTTLVKVNADWTTTYGNLAQRANLSNGGIVFWGNPQALIEDVVEVVNGTNGVVNGA